LEDIDAHDQPSGPAGKSGRRRETPKHFAMRRSYPNLSNYG
jgi:hypothetical protein